MHFVCHRYYLLVSVNCLDCASCSKLSSACFANVRKQDLLYLLYCFPEPWVMCALLLVKAYSNTCLTTKRARRGGGRHYL